MMLMRRLLLTIIFLAIIGGTSWEVHHKEPEITKRYAIIVIGEVSVKMELVKPWENYSKESQDSIRIQAKYKLLGDTIHVLSQK